MPVFKPRYTDPFSPVLLSADTTVAQVTPEQLQYIEWILSKSCSDSQFAAKAFNAITYVLLTGKTVPPVVASLQPSSVVLGSPSFDVHVMGENFTPASIIVFNGFEEPTTFVSATELTTGVNMDVWAAPAVVPIGVANNGVMSNTVDFTFNDAAARSSVKSPVVKPPDRPEQRK